MSKIILKRKVQWIDAILSLSMIQTQFIEFTKVLLYSFHLNITGKKAQLVEKCDMIIVLLLLYLVVSVGP